MGRSPSLGAGRTASSSSEGTNGGCARSSTFCACCSARRLSSACSRAISASRSPAVSCTVLLGVGGSQVSERAPFRRYASSLRCAGRGQRLVQAFRSRSSSEYSRWYISRLATANDRTHTTPNSAQNLEVPRDATASSLLFLRGRGGLRSSVWRRWRSSVASCVSPLCSPCTADGSPIARSVAGKPAPAMLLTGRCCPRAPALRHGPGGPTSGSTNAF
jgi:hypothetical protein